MSNGFDTLHHVGIIVSDMDRSISFYGKILDKEPSKDTTISGPALWRQTQVDDAVMRIVFFDFDNGGAGLELIEFTNKKGEQAIARQNTTGSLHFAFKVKDAQAAYGQLQAEGYQFIDAPQHMDEHYDKMKGFTFGYFRGPDSELVEIIENPGLMEKITG